MQLQKHQPIPVRVYQSDNRIMVAAPMPGLEPEDIRVTVEGTNVTIHGEQRGVHQDDRDLLMTEWEIGPYHRDLTLPEGVDGRTANAAYGNGVLVLIFPKAIGGASERSEILLEAVEPTVGMRIGHSGQQGADVSRGAVALTAPLAPPPTASPWRRLPTHP
jgi:HSP20 family protein